MTRTRTRARTVMRTTPSTVTRTGTRTGKKMIMMMRRSGMMMRMRGKTTV